MNGSTYESSGDPATEKARQGIVSSLKSVLAHFPAGCRITVLVRNPAVLDGSQDTVITTDVLEDVLIGLQFAIERRERKIGTPAPAPTGAQP